MEPAHFIVRVAFFIVRYEELQLNEFKNQKILLWAAPALSAVIW